MSRTALLLACVAFSPSPAVAQQPKTPFQVALDVSPDGGLVATCGDKVRVFEFESGKAYCEFDGPGSRTIAFSPAAKDTLAVGCEDGSIRVYDTAKRGLKLELKGHVGWVFSVAFDKSGKWLASTSRRFGNEDKKIDEVGQFKLWDAATGKAVKTIDVKGGWASAAAWSDDGKRVAFCRNVLGEGGAVTLDVYSLDPWESLASVKLPCELKGTRFGDVVRFLPGGRRLMVGGGVCVPASAAEAAPYKFACRPTGLLWGVELGDKPAAKLIEEPRRGYFNALSLSPDGKRYATNGSEVLPQVGTGSKVEVREVEGNKTVWQAADGPSVYGIRITPDGKFVTCIRPAFGDIRVYAAADGNALRLIPAEKRD